MGIQVSRGGKVHSRSDRASQGVTLCGRGDNSEYRLYVVREVDCAACVRIAGGVPKLDTPEYVREYNDAWKAHQEQMRASEVTPEEQAAAKAPECVSCGAAVGSCAEWCAALSAPYVYERHACDEQCDDHFDAMAPAPRSQAEQVLDDLETPEVAEEPATRPNGCCWECDHPVPGAHVGWCSHLLTVDHAFSSHSRRSAECRICKQGADIHATFDAETPMSEHQWRKVHGVTGPVSMPMVAEGPSGSLRRTGALAPGIAYGDVDTAGVWNDPGVRESAMWRAPKGGKRKIRARRHNFRMGR